MEDTITIFVCYKCRVPQAIEEKCKNKMCKGCFSDYKKKRYQENPIPTLEKTRAYRASHLIDLKQADKLWRLNNPGKIAAKAARWAKNNPGRRLEAQQRRRARKKGSQVIKITQVMLRDRLTIFGGQCAYCSGPFEHWDHVKPLELGGPHILSNLRPACAPCNIRKGQMTPNEWFLLIQAFNISYQHGS
jgi:5-methylcytosine-specific restriction endonuclease McrA